MEKLEFIFEMPSDENLASHIAIKGEKGDTALSVKVGETKTLEAGESAKVENSGTNQDLILDFSIPQGEIGDNNLIVSSTEPTTEEVWLRKAKNLFDYKNATYLNAFLDASNMKIVSSNTTNNHQTSYIRCEPNTTYTISKKAGKSFRIATTTDVPTVGTAINKTQANHTATSQTITTGANDNYLVFTCFSTYDGDTGTYIEIYKTVQVELGATSSTYENHVEDEILIKNANGNYEKFSDTVSIDNKEPNTKIWFRKTKNVFNFNSIIPNYISKCSQPANISVNYTNKSFTITNWNNNSYFPIIWGDLEALSGLEHMNLSPNTTYTLSFNSSNAEYLMIQIYYLDTTTNTYKMLTEGAKSEEITFTTNQFTKWVIRFGSTDASGSTMTISKIQLELGSATSYEEYVEDKIFVKNANGIHEEFIPVRKIGVNEFFTSTNSPVGEFEVYQQGNFINIQRILFNNVTVSEAETVLGAINSKFIPKSKKTIRILGSTGSSAIDCICFITGSGGFTTIHYDTPATGENGVYVFNTSYII